MVECMAQKFLTCNCKEVKIGLESGSQIMLNKMKKKDLSGNNLQFIKMPQIGGVMKKSIRSWKLLIDY